VLSPALGYTDVGAALPYMGALILVSGAALALVSAFDLLADDSTKAWRRLAEMRGYARPRSKLEKIATRVTFLRRIQEAFDLTRLLAIAGRDETALGYLGKAAAVGFGGAVAALFLDGMYYYAQGSWFMGLAPLIPVVLAWFLGTFLYIQQLKDTCNKRRSRAGQSLGDMLMLVAIMTDGRGLQLEDAVRILSRCVETPDLEAIVDKRGWQRVIHEPYHNTIELYRLIGEAYQVPQFLQLADAAANTNAGFGERDTYTRLAKVVYQSRLSEAKQKAARAKILVTLPVAGMLLPLLLLLGAPVFVSITQGLAG
jgi:hypothetical protein